MRVPLEWLHEYCRPELAADALGERLAMTGTEVERVEHHGVAALEHFVVGKVLEAASTPTPTGSDVCMVDIGDGQPSQIVCGAPNVAAGQTVAVATPGAVMPDGTTLRKAKLRGMESNGMILAEDELAIGTDHDGIMVLDDDQLEAGHAAGRGAADLDRRARARDHAEPARLPGDLRGRPRGPRRHRRAAARAAVDRGSRGRRRRRRDPDHRRVPRSLPAVHRAGVRGRRRSDPARPG